MGQYTLYNKRDCFESPMWMRSKRQPGIAREIDLRTVVIEKQEDAKTVQARSGHWPARRQLTDVVT
jgi:hypothetical protein